MPDPEPTQGDLMSRGPDTSSTSFPQSLPDRTQTEAAEGDKPILLIDDDDAGAQGMAKLLRRHGYTVLLAANGVAALRLVEKQTVGLVITDIFMDEMDGLETIMKLRHSHTEGPIIAISGGSPRIPMDCLSLARSLGAASALHKPVQIGDMLEAISRHGRDLARSRVSPPEGQAPA